MFDGFKNTFLNHGKYKTAHDAVIVSCFFNPENSPYRLLAFQKFYRSIKHLNHRIIECTIEDGQPQLPDSPYITRVTTDSLLWHKEALLNKVISELPAEFQYIFWVDADVIFTNDNWMVDAVHELQLNNIVQLFEYCVHLDQNQTKPSFDVDAERANVNDTALRNKKLWRSFAANYVTTDYSGDNNYDRHGHVGFAWGARREILAEMPLYDRALIGGADHIMAHAAAGQIPHNCIEKAFADNIAEITEWSKNFHGVCMGKLGYVKGDLYHIWHGDVEKRQYLKRIKEFTPQSRNINSRDANGLYIHSGDNSYMQSYYRQREVQFADDDYSGFDDGFLDDMGYTLAALADSLASTVPQPQPSNFDPPQGYVQSQDDIQTADVASTPVEASYGQQPDADSTPVEATYSQPDPDTTPVEADSGNFS